MGGRETAEAKRKYPDNLETEIKNHEHHDMNSFHLHRLPSTSPSAQPQGMPPFAKEKGGLP
jgi:hypothetical protein